MDVTFRVAQRMHWTLASPASRVSDDGTLATLSLRWSHVCFSCLLMHASLPFAWPFAARSIALWLVLEGQGHFLGNMHGLLLAPLCPLVCANGRSCPLGRPCMPSSHAGWGSQPLPTARLCLTVADSTMPVIAALKLAFCTDIACTHFAVACLPALSSTLSRASASKLYPVQAIQPALASTLQPNKFRTSPCNARCVTMCRLSHGMFVRLYDSGRMCKGVLKLSLHMTSSKLSGMTIAGSGAGTLSDHVDQRSKSESAALASSQHCPCGPG